MKDALGHGSNSQGAGDAAHQQGVNQIAAQHGIPTGHLQTPVGARDASGRHIVPGGQGYDPNHVNSSIHQAATAAGYTYSHTTPIYGRDGSVAMHHTYEQAGHTVSTTGSRGIWETTTGRGTGHRSTGNVSGGSLEQHLASKAKRYSELRG